jgi:hypothetical protein
MIDLVAVDIKLVRKPSPPAAPKAATDPTRLFAGNLPYSLADVPCHFGTREK